MIDIRRQVHEEFQTLLARIDEVLPDLRRKEADSPQVTIEISRLEQTRNKVTRLLALLSSEPMMRV